MQTSRKLQNFSQEFKTQAMILGGIIAFMWLLEIIDWVIFKGSLDGLGVRPRSIIGLRGIIFGPFLHVGFGHLIANTVPFLILGWFVLARHLGEFIQVTIIAIVVSGLGIWLIGPANSVHLGASGLIFGYFGYLLLRGYFERSWSSIMVSFFIAMLYGSLIFGVLPQARGISWQGHLFGFIGGGLAAYLLAPRRQQATLEDEITILS